MQVRRVELDFSQAKIHWNPEEPEYSQIWNALSTGVPYLEPFLIKVVRQLRDQLPESAVELRRDVDLFMAQEARHYKVHMRFNRLLHDAGYEAVALAEQRIKADYERFLAKGPKFSLAYCEGFETFGPMLSRFFFDVAPDLMKDRHDPTCYLWLWHLAEEYEHRTVCNYLYKAVYDDYWMRIYGLWYATLHLFGYTLRLAAKLIAKDRETGLIRGRWKSRLRYGRVLVRLFSTVLPPIVLRCMRPSYDPGPLPPPRNAMALLAEASERYGVLEIA